jgi:hypothetical protein
VCLQLLLQMPSCSMLATPLYTKRLCHVPLAEALLKPGGMTAWQVGLACALHQTCMVLQSKVASCAWSAELPLFCLLPFIIVMICSMAPSA